MDQAKAEAYLLPDVSKVTLQDGDGPKPTRGSGSVTEDSMNVQDEDGIELHSDMPSRKFASGGIPNHDCKVTGGEPEQEMEMEEAAAQEPEQEMEEAAAQEAPVSRKRPGEPGPDNRSQKEWMEYVRRIREEDEAIEAMYSHYEYEEYVLKCHKDMRYREVAVRELKERQVEWQVPQLKLVFEFVGSKYRQE